MMYGKTIWKPGSLELEPPTARINMLMHVGLWLTTIKLNPLWKTEVSKSAWIKSCCAVIIDYSYYFHLLYFTQKSECKQVNWDTKLIFADTNWILRERNIILSYLVHVQESFILRQVFQLKLCTKSALLPQANKWNTMWKAIFKTSVGLWHNMGVLKME